MPIPAPLIHIMRRQLGLIRRVQVGDAGIPADTLDSWLRSGELEAIERSVQRRPGGPRCTARPGRRVPRWPRCPGHGRVGVRAARPGGVRLRDRPWMAVPLERRVLGVDFIVTRTATARVDRATVTGAPSVTPIRDVIDAATRVQDKPLRVGIDDGRRRGMIDLDRLLRRAVDLGSYLAWTRTVPCAR